jgi:release factor glutamine methyltransferase
MADERTDLVDRLRAAGCVFAEEEAALLLAANGDLEQLVARRCAGEPLEHLLGWAEFAGLRVAVAPGVFVPRKRTELMAREVVALRPRLLVELCCGVAAVTAAVEAALPDVQTWAADIEPAAVEAARHNVRGQVILSDLDAALPAELHRRVDVIACNAPYVPTDEVANLPPEARKHEPRRALDGGSDGLDVIRRAASRAGLWLRSGGSLIVETSSAQAPVAAAAFEAVGLRPRVVRDLTGTVVLGLSTAGIVDTPGEVVRS